MTRALVVGLGNPGRRYERTWHNLGAMALDELASRHGLLLKKKRFSGRYAEGVIAGRPVALLKPETYMNLSGLSVTAAMAYHRVPLDATLILVDDLDLPLGALRLKDHSGAGSHNGLRDIEQSIGSGYVRLRLGMGPRPSGALHDLVLATIPDDKAAAVSAMLVRAADCVECWLADGLAVAQREFNQ